MRGGRRGQLNWLLEVLGMLLVLALFAYLATSYINAKANGDAYFSRFHAEDISTTADAVLASQGDVVLRYDNIKHDNRLSFWLDNGRVAVAKAGDVSAVTREPPSGAAQRSYGRASTYAGEYFIMAPTYLVLRKAGDTLGISTAETSLRSCASAPPTVPREEVRVYVEGTKETRDAFASALKGTPFTVVDAPAQATIRLGAARASGTANAVQCAPTSQEGASFCCMAAEQLGTITAVPFAYEPPAIGGQEFAVQLTVTTTQGTTLTNGQVGKALAYALAVHYK
jgi:hypothetical protein